MSLGISLDDNLPLGPFTPALGEPGPNRTFQRNIDIVGDTDEYRTVNYRSVIKDDVFNSLRTDFNIPKDYVIIRPYLYGGQIWRVRWVGYFSNIISLWFKSTTSCFCSEDYGANRGWPCSAIP